MGGYGAISSWLVENTLTINRARRPLMAYAVFRGLEVHVEIFKDDAIATMSEEEARGCQR